VGRAYEVRTHLTWPLVTGGASNEMRHDGLGELIGLEMLDADDASVRARVPVTDRIRQRYGLVHGGVYPVIAESICSAATARVVEPDGLAAFGQSNSATFLRPVSEGHINATAIARHRGRTTWIWDVELTDDEGRLCAMVRMTVAVRPS
jgi:1,4-dihydroxy-2-naphthoyl-CoA hydrolase